MLGDALRDQGERVLLGKAGENCLAVGGAVEREPLADRRQRDETLLPRNLVDEDRRAARQNRQIDGFADLVAERDRCGMKDVGGVGAERRGDARETCADSHAVTGLGLADELLPLASAATMRCTVERARPTSWAICARAQSLGLAL